MCFIEFLFVVKCLELFFERLFCCSFILFLEKSEFAI